MTPKERFRNLCYKYVPCPCLNLSEKIMLPMLNAVAPLVLPACNVLLWLLVAPAICHRALHAIVKHLRASSQAMSKT